MNLLQINSENPRYIHGYELLVKDILWEYDDTHIHDLNSIYIDEMVIDFNGNKIYKQAEFISNIKGNIGDNYYIMLDKSGKILLSTTKQEAPNTLCIGGFHYGRVRIGSEPCDVAVGIVPNSIWTIRFHPNCKNYDSMVYLGNFWGDIYLTRSRVDAGNLDDLNRGIGGVLYDSSAYGWYPATGKEGYNLFTFIDALKKVGKAPASGYEFLIGSDGAPEGLNYNNANAWTSLENKNRCKCGLIPNSVSNLNVCDLVGNVWKWNRDIISRNFRDVDNIVVNVKNLINIEKDSANLKNLIQWEIMPGIGRGRCSGGVGALLSGGYWFGGDNSGSRCFDVTDYPWSTCVLIGCWATTQCYKS